MDVIPQPNKNALALRRTTNGQIVCTLHYAADADKNPEFEPGHDWLQERLQSYPSGLDNPSWLQEMEIRYTAGHGGRFFPRWDTWRLSGNIIIAGDIDLNDATLYGSYDHGFTNPACYLVHALFPDGSVATIWELYHSGLTVEPLAKIISGESITTSDGDTLLGNPYAGRESLRICDPSIYKRDQGFSRDENKSIAYMFGTHGVHFAAGKKGDDIAFINLLLGDKWKDHMSPTYYIHENCKNLIWEIGRLERQSISSVALKTRNEPERMVDKNNHAFDALKYFMMRMTGAPTVTKKPDVKPDFTYFKDIHKTRRISGRYTRDVRPVSGRRKFSPYISYFVDFDGEHKVET